MGETWIGMWVVGMLADATLGGRPAAFQLNPFSSLRQVPGKRKTVITQLMNQQSDTITWSSVRNGQGKSIKNSFTYSVSPVAGETAIKTVLVTGECRSVLGRPGGVISQDSAQCARPALMTWPVTPPATARKPSDWREEMSDTVWCVSITIALRYLFSLYFIALLPPVPVFESQVQNLNFGSKLSHFFVPYKLSHCLPSSYSWEGTAECSGCEQQFCWQAQWAFYPTPCDFRKSSSTEVLIVRGENKNADAIKSFKWLHATWLTGDL